MIEDGFNSVMSGIAGNYFVNNASSLTTLSFDPGSFLTFATVSLNVSTTGDRSQELLCRLQQGEFSTRVYPKVAIISIGINNVIYARDKDMEVNGLTKILYQYRMIRE